MSATPLIAGGFQTAEVAKYRAERLAKWLGISSTDKETLLEAFYNASPEDLTRGTYNISEVPDIAQVQVSSVLWYYFYDFLNEQAESFIPTIENATIATDPVLTECIVNKWYAGNFTKVPQILGFMHLETVAYACPGLYFL